MKKIFILILFIFNSLLSLSQKENEIGYIASFNILRLGSNKKDYDEIGKILNSFDIIGLIEVFSKNGVLKVVDSLEKYSNEDWNYHIAPYPVGTNKYKEYYAFVYRTKKVEFLKSRKYFKDTDNDFIREPYGADFKIGNMDFTFILLHSIYGKKKSQRVAEAMALDKVYDYFQNLDPIENDIIIGGDFNLSVRDYGFKKLLSHKDNIIYTISPNIKTTIGTKGLANQYDNIFISTKYTTEFTGISGALDFTNGNFLKARSNISDHLPIFIQVNTLIDDD
ncbi:MULTISPECIES: endonuclease/exonuclease/phosphatase family protein [Fusobacterium]|uniref:endonuclease/exonuclease/phosphatase family protein n=1 Tax=Fusobacterium TaxID=848 RepID=UPI001476DBF0|nr:MULTISPECIES: endonuclease/exonuclease/phosphatase family protein [Fusobacterium]NME35466.1 endonuclease/exonuclease/phosphatase family protein [Fusobacterium sp. FSA-380-WT-3A]